VADIFWQSFRGLLPLAVVVHQFLDGINALAHLIAIHAIVQRGLLGDQTFLESF
jgi:hypothetical protein